MKFILSGVAPEFRLKLVSREIEGIITPGPKMIDETCIRFTFNVIDENDFTGSIPYEFSILKFQDGKLKIDQMNNHGNPIYTKKGITLALIRWTSENFKSDIESSSKEYPRRFAEKRSEDADTFWKKMEISGLASYEDKRDVYIYKYIP